MIQKKISLDGSWQRIPMYFKNNTIPWIDISISVKGETPVKLSTYIDFADGDAIVLLQKQEMIFTLPDNLEPTLLSRGLSGDVHGEKGNISKLIIDNYQLNDVTAMVASAEIRSKQIGAEAIIGNDALRRFNLILCYDDNMLYIKPNKYIKDKFE